jgi:methyl coenzyme M reductase alpha subunit
MEAIKDKVEEAYPDVSTNQPLIRLRREQKRRERKMVEMAKRMMFEEVLAKYIPIYDKAFA